MSVYDPVGRYNAKQYNAAVPPYRAQHRYLGTYPGYLADLAVLQGATLQTQTQETALLVPARRYHISGARYHTQGARYRADWA
eukprot:3663086-Rhodomonas_salina.1